MLYKIGPISFNSSFFYLCNLTFCKHFVPDYLYMLCKEFEPDKVENFQLKCRGD